MEIMPTRPTTEPSPEDADKAEPLTVSSEELLAGRRQLIIQHGGERYRLLLTRSNKLILTK
jgi:hemin uptake protein HemP